MADLLEGKSFDQPEETRPFTDGSGRVDIGASAACRWAAGASSPGGAGR